VIETTESVYGFKAVGESLEAFVLCVVARRIVAVVGKDLLRMLVSGGNGREKERGYLVFQAVLYQHLVKFSCEPVTCVRLKQQRGSVSISAI
jgi:hypothetical protein